MTHNENNIKTAEELLGFLDDADLGATQHRDLKCAIKRVCEMAGFAPTNLRLEVPLIRETLRKILPARHDVSAKTWANMRSLLGAALELAGVIDRMGRGVALRHPVWGPLMGAIAPDKRLAGGLASFANWCTAQGISPDDVSDAVLQEFHTWLETRTLCPKPRDIVRRVPHLWNEASEQFEVWPKIKLTTLSFKAPRLRLPLEALSESFQDDTKAYLAMRGDPDLFDERPNAPKRRLAVSTLRVQSEHLRLAASILVESGVPVEDIASLTVLVEPERFKTVLRHYHERAKGKPNAFAGGLATTLIQVAQYHVGATPEEIARLKGLASKLPPIPFELTDKNKDLLRQLESEELRAKLLFLPEKFQAEVTETLETGRIDFVKAQMAIAIDIELAIPLRLQNLSRLNWRRHFSEPDGPKGRTLLHIPKAEMKSGKQDYDADIPDHVARRLRWYRRQILPRLGADVNGDLFITKKGNRKHQKTLAGQIILAIADNLGIHMTPHQFRHFCAVSYLDENPQDMETARALLGHVWSKTTQIYVGSPSRRAARAYGDFLSEQRGALKFKAKRRPHRKNKKEPA